MTRARRCRESSVISRWTRQDFDTRDYRRRYRPGWGYGEFDRRRNGLSQVQNVLVDGGYTGKPFATAVQGLLGARWKW